MMRTLRGLMAATAVVAVAAAPVAVSAADKVRLILSTKVVFEMEHGYSATENGVFAKYAVH